MLSIILPDPADLGELKDMAQEVIDTSARLEGRMALETARVIGDHLRLANSYYSNLIEGHRTTIVAVEQAMQKKFSADDAEKYAQELCLAHVRTEKQIMESLERDQAWDSNVADVDFLRQVHQTFYASLPERHLFTHGSKGFTIHPVMPGVLRDCLVSVGAEQNLGPTPQELPKYMRAFSQYYDPANFHGDERLIAMAASHHRLTWIHPFRDGNGRVCRLFSGFYMARVGVNRANLWSLSRGLSRAKTEYMINLNSADPDPRPFEPGFMNESQLVADFCRFFFEVCLDQIKFMQRLLQLENIESRIEWFVERKIKTAKTAVLHKNSARLLRALFMRGSVERGEGPAILNVSETTYRRVLRQLLDEKLIVSDSPKAPLKVAIPVQALPTYFPGLYNDAEMGAQP